MPLLQTDAIVLHTAAYLESSLILRLATREGGVQSVVARGARSSKKRFGSAVDLFAEGQAQIQMKAGRDLHALQAFDVTAARPSLALDLGRFTAASAIAECVLRLVHEEAAPAVFDTLRRHLDLLAQAPPAEAASATLAALWHLVAEAGYRPTVEHCAECHTPIGAAEAARFHVIVGGVLCAACSRQIPGGRLLPAEARATLAAWTAGARAQVAPSEARAHQRLLREFLSQHLPDNRPLKAFQVWEHGGW